LAKKQIDLVDEPHTWC